MKMSKRWLIPAGIVAALLLWVVVGRGESTDSSYRFVEVERGDVASVVSSTGKLQATQTVEVGTQVSGQVSEILVDFNDRVRAGQLIARIDPTLPLQEVRSAEASLQRVEAELAQSQRDLERARGLHQQQVVTDSELEQAEYGYAVARASYNAAQVSLERARRNLGYTEIRAPVNGVVIERSVDVGQTVAASMSAPTLFVIAEDLSSMEILATVDESDIGRIREGQEVRFTVQAYPEQEFIGTVTQVRLQSTVQENVVSYSVVVTVPNETGLLLPGMTATVEFIIERAEGVLSVPNSAVRFRATDQMRAQLAAAGGSTAANAAGPAGDSAAATQPSARRRRAAADSSATAPTGGAASIGESAGATRTRVRAGSSARATLWVLDEGGRLDTMVVRTGLSDGQRTAVYGDRLTEGMQVIAGVTSGDAGGSANPFQPQQQEQRRGPPGAF